MKFKSDKYLKQLLEKQNNSLIKVITGARRSRKSYLLNNIFYRELIKNDVEQTHIIKFAFDNDKNIDLLEKYYPNESTRIVDKTGYYTINSKKV